TANQYDVRFGTLASTTDPNGIITSKTYDGFGRVATETRADGVQSTTTFGWCQNSWSHPPRTCTNGTDTCTTPSSPDTAAPIPGNVSTTASYGCSLGYWSGYNYCYGNPVNGTCPSSGIGGPSAQGSFDFAHARVTGSYENALLCYPANVQSKTL